MDIFLTIIGILLFLVFLVLLIAFICFLKVFYFSEKSKKTEEFPLPRGKAYEPFYDQMIDWQKKAREMDFTEVYTTSFDGLKLYGRYFEYSPDSPIELIFHGYKGDSTRDLTGAIFRCFELKHSVLLVDHRSSGKSQGNVCTFGVKECEDCKTWVNYIVNNISNKAKINIGGVSMGAATVMLASAEELPENVVCVLADCGYTSAEDIIKKVMADMKLPPNLLFPFVKLGAKIFGNFDIDKANPLKAMEHCKLPIIFFHGDEDDFVPLEMSKRNFDACNSKKTFVTIKGAAHGLCYPVNQEQYINELREFYKDILD